MNQHQKLELMKWLFQTSWWKAIETDVHNYLDTKESLQEEEADMIADMISDAGGTG